MATAYVTVNHIFTSISCSKLSELRNASKRVLLEHFFVWDFDSDWLNFAQNVPKKHSFSFFSFALGALCSMRRLQWMKSHCFYTLRANHSIPCCGWLLNLILAERSKLMYSIRHVKGPAWNYQSTRVMKIKTCDNSIVMLFHVLLEYIASYLIHFILPLYLSIESCELLNCGDQYWDLGPLTWRILYMIFAPFEEQ